MKKEKKRILWGGRGEMCYVSCLLNGEKNGHHDIVNIYLASALDS